jgi:hypothetical protein
VGLTPPAPREGSNRSSRERAARKGTAHIDWVCTEDTTAGRSCEEVAVERTNGALHERSPRDTERDHLRRGRVSASAAEALGTR